MNSLKPNGAPMRAFMIAACLLLQLVWAREVMAQDATKAYANVWKIRGEVVATKEGGASRTLREGSPVFVGEKVQAAPNSEAVLKTTDVGVIAVRPGAEFVVERYSAEGKSSDTQVVRLLKGSLRLISGWIGKSNRGGSRVDTPTATIGIRGTDHEPYVLTKEMAADSEHQEGTYDKVNSGATALSYGGYDLEIEPGKVGFAREQVRTRALMTILLPILLEKVPEFYVPGQFDAELDRYAKTAEKAVPPGGAPVTPARPPKADKPAATTPATPARPTAADPAGCAVTAIAKSWLSKFDRAIEMRDSAAVIAMLAPEITAKAIVRSGSGTSTLEFTRDEMVKSTLDSIANLKNWQQRRITVEAKLPDGETGCSKIDVSSVVIETGIQAGKQYRFESTEEYRLELRDGNWLAVKAATTQR